MSYMSRIATEMEEAWLASHEDGAPGEAFDYVGSDGVCVCCGVAMYGEIDPVSDVHVIRSLVETAEVSGIALVVRWPEDDAVYYLRGRAIGNAWEAYDMATPFEVVGVVR